MALLRLVRERDRDRYLAALFAPAGVRDSLLALYAFNSEIARAREVVREPILGQMRLQWWRETIAAIYEGGPVRRHEVAEPLAAAIRERGLSRAHFDRLIEAREADFADAPPADLAALEAYAEATSAPLVMLALQCFGLHDPAAEDMARALGIAYALAGLVRAVPFHAKARRLYLPADRLAAARLDPERTIFVGRFSDALGAVTGKVADRARFHLAAARARQTDIPRRARAALLPAVVAARVLKRLARAGHNPFAPDLQRPDAALPLALALAAARGRV
ncbi:MAG TPA: squalene/phytoene synthase family protein [Stellaceae bacterium]|nr:squalene/phytoene synthase family protein [Stellaceae bacterium]